MADNVETQLKQLDVEMKKAKTQTEKDAIKERQAELKRQLEGSKKKQRYVAYLAESLTKK